MVESDFFDQVFKIVLDKYAYSLDLISNQGNKQFVLQYKDCNSVGELSRFCSEGNVNLSEGVLVHLVEQVKNTSMVFNPQKQLLGGLFKENDFFVGEIVELYENVNSHVSMIKIDRGKWWITSQSGYDKLSGVFVRMPGNIFIGENMPLNLCEFEIKPTNCYCLVRNPILKLMDEVLMPYLYEYSSEDSSLEGDIIIPLYEHIREGKENIPFDFFKELSQMAMRNAVDTKVLWYIANAVSNNYQNMYR